MDCSEVIDENSKDLNKCPALKKIEFDNKAHLKKYIMWENKSNICWLDSSMALVAHNRTMKKYSGVSPQCNINKIISAYDDAIRIINGSENTMQQKLNLARRRLNYIQESTLDYLQPILKYKTGDPESAFCSLYNILIQDPVVKKIFDVTWLSVKECSDCGHNSESIKSKPIVTLSKIHSFDPENLKVIYRCNCNKSEQTMKLVFVSLPPCLIFHFENGAGNEKPPLSFITQRRVYYLTGIMTLEKSQDSTVNHFITWVRDPSVDKWLDCNDLNLDVICFSPDFPDINIKDVYMYVYEAFDDLGTITDSKIVKDKKSEENIPIFYLSDNSDAEMSDSQISATESNKDSRENKPLKPDLKSSSAKLDRNISLRRTLTTDKNAIEKSVQQADCSEHLKNISHNMINENIDEGQTKPIEVDEDKIPYENIKTDKNKVLKTSISPGSNWISTASNCAKEISKDICKSDSSTNENNITEKINENSFLFPNSRDDSLTSDDRHNDFVTKDSISAENEPSYKNEKEKNSKNASKNIRNNELLSKVARPNISKTVIPNPLKRLKIKDLIRLKCSDKTNVKKDDINNSQHFQTSNAEEREDKFILNSNGQQEKLSSHFLTNVGASSSGTSYVKIVRRKKIISDPLNKANFENDSVNPDLSEALDNTYVATPSTSTSLKTKGVAEDEDYVPLSEKSKKKKLSNGGKELLSSEKKIQEDLQSAQRKSQVKSKLNNTSTRTVGNNSGSNDSHTGPGRRADAAQNSSANSANHVTILRDFADSLSCHETGCNCASAKPEEIVDSTVDFVYAYWCKLAQEFQEFSE